MRKMIQYAKNRKTTRTLNAYPLHIFKSKLCRLLLVLILVVMAKYQFIFRSNGILYSERSGSTRCHGCPTRPTSHVWNSHDVAEKDGRLQSTVAQVHIVVMIGTKWLADGVTETEANEKLHSIITSFKDCNYGKRKVNLDTYLFNSMTKRWSNRTANLLHFVNWPHGYHIIHMRTVDVYLDYVLKIDIPRSDLISDLVLVDVEQLGNLRSDWYQYILSVKKGYGENAEIIGYSVGGKERWDDLKSSIEEKEKHVYLQQSLGDAGIFVPRHISLWRSFLQWLHRNRADWYLWPTLVDVQSRHDRKWNTFQPTVQARWQIWLARYSSIHDVFVLHNFKHNPAPLSPSTIDSQNDERSFLHLSMNGSIFYHKQHDSRISGENIGKVVQIARQNNNFVSLTILNSAFLETAKSWLCNVDAGGFRPPGIVWIATDEESFVQLSEIQNTHAIYISDIQGAKNGAAFGNPSYWLLMLERTNLLLDVLRHGCSIFLFETDQVWLRDPMPIINRVLMSEENIDLIGTLDFKEIAGNFLIFRPSLTMRKVYSEVCRIFESEYRRLKIEKKPASSVSYMHNDQSILTRLVLYDTRFRLKHPVGFRVLDPQLFACGKWYDGKKGMYSSMRSRSPVIINNNFVGIKFKTDRLKKFGHWFLTDDKCDESRVKAAIKENEQRYQNYLKQRRYDDINSSRLLSSPLMQNTEPDSNLISTVIYEEQKRTEKD